MEINELNKNIYNVEYRDRKQKAKAYYQFIQSEQGQRNLSIFEEVRKAEILPYDTSYKMKKKRIREIFGEFKK